MPANMEQGMPPIFRSAKLSELDPAQFEFAAEYYQSMRDNLKQGVGVLLSGPPGVGKSYAMAALTMGYARRAARAGSWHFETVPDLLDKYRPMTGAQVHDSFREQPWTTTYDTVKWLVLNDMGKEYRGGKMHEQAVAKLGRLIRRRAEQKLTTHITTNLVIDTGGGDLGFGTTFASVYGESLWSLLHECTQGYVVWGPDRRFSQK